MSFQAKRLFGRIYQCFGFERLSCLRFCGVRAAPTPPCQNSNRHSKGAKFKSTSGTKQACWGEPSKLGSSTATRCRWWSSLLFVSLCIADLKRLRSPCTITLSTSALWREHWSSSACFSLRSTRWPCSTSPGLTWSTLGHQHMEEGDRTSSETCGFGNTSETTFPSRLSKLRNSIRRRTTSSATTHTGSSALVRFVISPPKPRDSASYSPA